MPSYICHASCMHACSYYAEYILEKKKLELADQSDTAIGGH